MTAACRDGGTWLSGLRGPGTLRRAGPQLCPLPCCSQGLGVGRVWGVLWPQDQHRWSPAPLRPACPGQRVAPQHFAVSPACCGQGGLVSAVTTQVPDPGPAGRPLPTPSPTQCPCVSSGVSGARLLDSGETETARRTWGSRPWKQDLGLWGPRSVCLLSSGNSSGSEGTEVWGALGQGQQGSRGAPPAACEWGVAGPWACRRRLWARCPPTPCLFLKTSEWVAEIRS